jgi:hypothetical protein
MYQLCVVSASGSFVARVLLAVVLRSLERVVLLELIILAPNTGGLMQNCSTCGISILRALSVGLRSASSCTGQSCQSHLPPNLQLL